MAYTLTDYKAYMTAGQSPVVIDEIVKSDYLLRTIPFTSNGVLMNNKWVYQYTRREYQLTANIRQVGNEYTPQEIEALQDYTVELSIFGGSYNVDRVMENAGNLVQFVTENEEQLIKATRTKFGDLVINGDNSNAGEFDGLDVALAGSTTEYGLTEYLDMSSQAAVEANWKTFEFSMDDWLSLLVRKPDALLIDDKFMPKFKAAAKLSGAYTRRQDEFGNTIEEYDGIPLVKLGEKPGSSTRILAPETRTIDGSSVTGLVDIYGVCFGPQEFHAVAPNNNGVVKVYRPDFAAPGAVKLGEVEMIATVALEQTKAAGVFRNIKIL